jgi:two-component system OmpR family response regulator
VIAQALREQEFAVDVADDGEEGLSKALLNDYDAIILDLMLPRMHGLDVLRHLRREKKTPVLILTARDETLDKISGLNQGADDFVTKPFDLGELLARIRALLRRSVDHPSPLVRIGQIEVNLASREVFKGGELVPLTRQEYAILQVLVLNQGKLVSRTMIYDALYGEDDDTLSNVVDVYIANLRKRLGAELIETRRGEGYIVRG